MKRTRFVLTAVFFVLTVMTAWNVTANAAKPKSVIEKMVKAYGGEKGIEKLQSFRGVGFIKDLSSTEMAKSDPFDIFKRGVRYKHRRFRVVRGVAKDVIIAIFDGKEGYEWMYSAGKARKKESPSWEYDILKYKFPVVLKWAEENMSKAKAAVNIKKDRLYKVDFTNGNNLLSLYVGDKDGLLRRIELRDKSDSTFSYSEVYSDYRDIGKIPFPSRFTGYYKGSKYYEFFLPTVDLGVQFPDSTFRVNADDTEDIEP